jgi:2-methylisocitrate lyase-like PEP mutase family enzyme
VTYQFIMPLFRTGNGGPMLLDDRASDLEILLAAHLKPAMPPLLLPGCWDAFSGQMIERAGHNAAWIGRGAVAACITGSADVALATAGMMADATAKVRDSGNLALVVDAGNGFGNAFNVARTVVTLESAGAQAIRLADDLDIDRRAHQEHLTANMIGKIKAAVDARGHSLLIAQSFRPAGEELNAMLDRLSAYVEAGADIIGISGALSPPELGRLVEWARTRVPLIFEHDQPVDPAQFTGVAILCQPMLLQRQLAAAASGIMAPPSSARTPPSVETLRSLSS